MRTFRLVTVELGAQGAVCAGGRYDGWVETPRMVMFAAPPTSP